MRFRRKSIGDQSSAYLLIAPSYLIFLLFIVVPIICTIVLSFTNYNMIDFNYIGIKNYSKLVKDELFLKSLKNTIRYAALTIPPSIIIGLGLALLLNKKMPGRSIFRTAIFLPYIFSMVVVAIVWSYLYDANVGIINRFFTALGLSKVRWLTDKKMAMISLSIMSIWQRVGYTMILFLSGLQSIDSNIYEAASIDGVNPFQRFRFITLPLLRPTTFFVTVMACINAFQVFGEVLILTNGGPLNSTTTIAHNIYQNGFLYLNMGYASAQAVVLLLIIMGITLINMRFGKGDDNDE